MRPADLPVLRAALRTRSLDAERLATAVGASPPEVRAALERLTNSGLLTDAGDGGADIVAPHRALVETALGELDAHLEALARVRNALESLPRRVQEEAGRDAAGGARVPMELLHGADAVVDAWWRLDTLTRAVDVFASIPDPEVLARIADETRGTHAAPGSRIRVLTARREDARAPSAVLHEHGAEVRALERPAGWFAGEGGELSSFPTSWGVPWPRSVRMLRDPLAALSLRSLFDELWNRAVELDERPAEWEPVLRLLEQGMGDAEVAVALGVSERTVRRRVEEAMLDLGATTRFTLGRAWAARR